MREVVFAFKKHACCSVCNAVHLADCETDCVVVSPSTADETSRGIMALCRPCIDAMRTVIRGGAGSTKRVALDPEVDALITDLQNRSLLRQKLAAQARKKAASKR